MPSLDSHPSTEFVKALLLGDPGAGKTGSLTSLVAAGFDLRIYDFDNLLTPLVQYCKKTCPDKIGNVKFQTFTDKFKGIDQPVTVVQGGQNSGPSLRVQPFVDGMPDSIARAMRQLNNWKTDTEDLGPPAQFGKNSVVVIDSLTSLSAAAFRYCQAMNPTGKEQRTYYFSAQQMIQNILSLLCSEQFRTNIIIIAHVSYSENHQQITKGFPRSIGAALNEQIAAYFNCVLLAESIGNGTSVRRTIRTNSTGIVDLKNPVSFRVPDSLPLETGLATFFEAVRT